MNKLIFHQDHGDSPKEIHREFLKFGRVLVLVHSKSVLGGKYSVLGWVVNYQTQKLRSPHVAHFLMDLKKEGKDYKFEFFPWGN